MIEVIRAAAELQAFCESQGWRFCFIGGLALQRWGEPRETADVDLTLLTGFGGEEPFVRKLLERFDARIADAADFALTRRVLLLRARSGVGLDIALGGLPFEESVVARSSLFAFPANATAHLLGGGSRGTEGIRCAAPRIGWTWKGLSFARPESSTGPISAANSSLWPNSKKLPKSWRNLNAVEWNSEISSHGRRSGWYVF